MLSDTYIFYYVLKYTDSQKYKKYVEVHLVIQHHECATLHLLIRDNVFEVTREPILLLTYVAFWSLTNFKKHIVGIKDFRLKEIPYFNFDTIFVFKSTSSLKYSSPLLSMEDTF